MTSRVTPEDRLDGWEAISHYLGWTPRTAIRWEKQKGLPVHRLAGGKRQPVYAYRREIDQWFQRTRGRRPTAAKSERETASRSRPEVLPTRRISRWAISAIIAAVTLFISALAIAWRMPLQPVIQITGITQLTDDGTAKRNLVTDGKQLYFSEEVGDEDALATMSASGGPIRRIPLPLPNPYPVDISPDGKSLLVLSAAGIEDEHPLWIVPTASGPPSQILGVKCRTAAWSPNGKWIAFGSGGAIYLTSRNGHTRLLSRVSGIPRRIQWSADGKHLLFFLLTLPAGTASLWQLGFDDKFDAGRAAPLHLAGATFRQDEPLTRGEGGYFTVSNDSTTDHLVQFRPNPWWRKNSFEVSALSTHFDAIDGLAANDGARKLFVLSGSRQQGELVRYDLSTRSFTMMLPGTSATYVDWTKNKDLVAYVNSQNRALWTSRADGTGAKQLSPAGMEVELPRWSPNSKWIAFMGKQPNRPWRIFLTPAAGGVPKEASSSDDNQGAPTWSPDGRFLVYGNVVCEEEHTCAIHKINLTNSKITTLPDSQGLGTARWSPDGRHIAALNPVQHELCIFDTDRQKWRKLAEGINGNDVSWSSDSRFVYTKSSMNGQATILRVAVGGGAVQTVLNLDSFSKSAGQLDTWFSLAPDNALLLNRWLNTSEIYALASESDRSPQWGYPTKVQAYRGSLYHHSAQRSNVLAVMGLIRLEHFNK
jgi:Tol biopolymer transport system component